MLTPAQPNTASGEGFRFAIVAARYNPKYVDAMLEACQRELKQAGATATVARVPGSFEIPAVAAHFASSAGPVYDAVICLGVIFQGETKHADHIGASVTHALAQLQIMLHVPVIHSVQLFADEEQARVRCLGVEHNRGSEAARAALSMAELMRSLK